MSDFFRVLELDELRDHLQPALVIAAVRDAFIRYAEGDADVPPPLQLLFNKPKGDCHVKAGRFRSGGDFVVKVATGFYENPARDLPVNDGLILLFDASTGRPKALLRDHGWLTSWRTAAAGALAAEAGGMPKDTILGIIGTGHQARLQAEWTARHLGLGSVRVHGRSREGANKLAIELTRLGLDARVCHSVDDLCEAARMIITCTPSDNFILPARSVHPGTHIVALGADSAGKQELEPALFGRADWVLADSREQCAHHGDLSYALAQNILSLEDVGQLGDILARPIAARERDTISVVDLTGISVQDLAIASLALGNSKQAPLLLRS